ncbi:hypothetical protein [Streptomyces sp. NPDC088785]|uniref:hypothetical protein n=1 Tax=Streptomyces sp. NPDC088785 TaxID=3365897 RepID=UPI0037F850E7
MTIPESAAARLTPIYDLLVEERGDALTVSRTAAEDTHAFARRALDWSGVRDAARERDVASFSPFGHHRESADLA